MIKKYKDFIREKIAINQNDSTEMASDKSTFNQIESYIKEFLSKKTTLDNIYVTYKDEKDLISKLYAQKFIPTNTSDKKKIQFINPLFGLYAQAAEKKSELKSIESDLDKNQKSLSDSKSLLSQTPENSESISNDIQYTQSKISEITNSISKLKTEIVTLERNTESKLKSMKSDLLNNKKRVDYFSK